MVCVTLSLLLYSGHITKHWVERWKSHAYLNLQSKRQQLLLSHSLPSYQTSGNGCTWAVIFERFLFWRDRFYVPLFEIQSSCKTQVNSFGKLPFLHPRPKKRTSKYLFLETFNSTSIKLRLCMLRLESLFFFSTLASLYLQLSSVSSLNENAT